MRTVIGRFLLVNRKHTYIIILSNYEQLQFTYFDETMMWRMAGFEESLNFHLQHEVKTRWGDSKKR